MQPLPIDPHVPELVAALERRGALVCLAQPGAGKTTRLAPALLDAAFARAGEVVLLQPRRIAALAAAARIAEERGWTIGREVGFQVRFERRVSRDTRLRVVTEGVLLRQLQADPFLDGVAAVLLDEFHERSLEADLCLALLREVREAARTELRIGVLSATLDPEPVAAFLGGCPVVEVPGRLHPITVRYRPSGLRDPPGPAAAAALRSAWHESRGHALVFLPGIGAIRDAARELEGFAASADVRVHVLHGSLGLDEQREVLRPSRERKVILATNIAETSLTIDGVDLVIDSGLARVLRSDPAHGIDRLETERISLHSAEQRAGRAGRQGPGTVIRLWSEIEHSRLERAPEPDIRRVDLARAVLELRAWGAKSAREFRWLEPPDAAALERAERLLGVLGATAPGAAALTPLGRRMLDVPVHPRLAGILIACGDAGYAREGAILAALLEERDIVPRDDAAGGGARIPRAAAPASGASDLLARLELFEAAAAAGFAADPVRRLGLDRGAVESVRRASADLERRAAAGSRAPTGAPPPPPRETALSRALLLGYADRVVRRRDRRSDRGVMVGGRGVRLDPASIVREGELFIALDADAGRRGERSEALVRIASRVEPSWVEEDLAELISERRDVAFDERLGRARATVVRLLIDLPLAEPREVPASGAEIEALLAAAARERADEIIAANESLAGWLVRARCLRSWMPELELPDFDSGLARDILAASCAGRRSLDELRRCDLLAGFQATLTHAQRRAIEQHAPEALEVPSGSRIRLEYEPGRPPVLAVRLQELFGLAETPRVAAGRVPVVLHILGPNFRAVQVTQDLSSFWNNTYSQVRKDLRARYPKHAWPEDPWSAEPVRGPRRRKGG